MAEAALQASTSRSRSLMWGMARIDRVGLLAAPIAVAALFLPFMNIAANRIVEGEPRPILESLTSVQAAGLFLAVGAMALAALLRVPPASKAVMAGATALVAAIFAGLAADNLAADAGSFARIRPASGFWLLLFACFLTMANAMAHIRLNPWVRLALGISFPFLLVLLVASGIWSNLSLLKEYANQAQAFWREAGQHLFLSGGSLLFACIAGIPLGIFCRYSSRARPTVLNGLTFIQTIPSLALFGLLIAPLSWFAAHIPFAASLGIKGIGTAPALLALFAYSLLPIVLNTLAGLENVPAATREAARGMGMTGRQQLMRVELPLALPAVLAGIRIVLIQNIGLATIAALIGGGGFGVFVFQGLSQAAIDLVLLGVIPTIVLSFTAAVLMDALIDISRASHRRTRST